VDVELETPHVLRHRIRHGAFTARPGYERRVHGVEGHEVAKKTD
jgi:hypothetical protein